MRPLAILCLAFVPLVACGDDESGGGGGDGGSGTGAAGSGAAGTGATGTGAAGTGATGTGAAGGAAAACANGPLSAPIPGCTPSPVPNSGDPQQDCVDRINQFRWECQCLPPLGRWTAAEPCVSQQAEYDSANGPHAGFVDGICSDGGMAFAQNECPGWGSVEQVIEGCLQQMWDEGPGADFQSHGHYLSMSSTDYSEVACGFYTTGGGEVWAAQNFH